MKRAPIIGTNVYLAGDMIPLCTLLLPDVVLALLRDTEIAAAEAGVSAFMRLRVTDPKRGLYADAMVRPSSVAALLPIPEGDFDDDDEDED